MSGAEPIRCAVLEGSQPIAAREVADRLMSSLRLNRSTGRAVARLRWTSGRAYGTTGARGRVLEVLIPVGMGRAMRESSLLPRPGAQLGKQTFDHWIIES